MHLRYSLWELGHFPDLGLFFTVSHSFYVWLLQKIRFSLHLTCNIMSLSLSFSLFFSLSPSFPLPFSSPCLCLSEVQRKQNWELFSVKIMEIPNLMVQEDWTGREIKIITYLEMKINSYGLHDEYVAPTMKLSSQTLQMTVQGMTAERVGFVLHTIREYLISF